MARHSVILIIGAISIVFFFWWYGASQALTLHTTDDTNINLNQPGQNNGAHAQVFVRNVGSGGVRHAFVKFDLSPLPAGTTVDKAILRLFPNNIQNTGDLTLHEVLADWDEANLTAGTAPPLGAVLQTVSVAGDKKDYVAVELPVGVVQAWVDNPALNFGVALLPDATNNIRVQFDGKENGATSHPMELEVALSNVGEIGPQGPQGIQGATGPQGVQGIPGNLALAGQLCSFGEVLTGFDSQGNIVCASFSPPALAGINGPFTDVAQGFIDQFCGIINPPDPTCQDQFAVMDQLTRYEISGQAQPGEAISIFLSPTCDAGTEWNDEDGPLGQFFTANIGDIASLILTPGFIDTVFGTSNTVQSNGTYTSTLLIVGTPPGLISIQSSLGGSSCSNALAVPQ